MAFFERCNTVVQFEYQTQCHLNALVFIKKYKKLFDIFSFFDSTFTKSIVIYNFSNHQSFTINAGFPNTSAFCVKSVCATIKSHIKTSCSFFGVHENSLNHLV